MLFVLHVNLAMFLLFQCTINQQMRTSADPSDTQPAILATPVDKCRC